MFPEQHQGFREVSKRLAALGSLQKNMKLWVDTQDDSVIIKVKAPLEILKKYLALACAVATGAHQPQGALCVAHVPQRSNRGGKTRWM